VSANATSSPSLLVNATNLIAAEADDPPAENATEHSMAQHTPETAVFVDASIEPLPSLTGHVPVKINASMSPLADV